MIEIIIIIWVIITTVGIVCLEMKNNKIKALIITMVNLEKQLEKKNKNIQDLKKLIETPDHAEKMFPNIDPKNIYFGNLTINSDYTSVDNSLFIYIGDFKYGISIDHEVKYITLINNLLKSI